MDVIEVMDELEQLGKERIKKRYLKEGAKEPLYGVATGDMKPLKKMIKKNQMLANELYSTGNYDAMYFAGVIADPKIMTRNEFEQWINHAYFYMISDYVVAVTLSESPLVYDIADDWINSEDELTQSAGWHAYCWLIGHKKDDLLDIDRLKSLLYKASDNIHDQLYRVQVAMSYFISCVGISCEPLHELAVRIATELGEIHVTKSSGEEVILNPLASIEKAKEKNRIGFKRRYVRC